MTINRLEVGRVGSYNVLLHADPAPLSPTKTRDQIGPPSQKNGIGIRKHINNGLPENGSHGKKSVSVDTTSNRKSNNSLIHYWTKNSNHFSLGKNDSSHEQFYKNYSQKVDKNNSDPAAFDDGQENAKIIREATRLLVAQNETLKSGTDDSKTERAAKHLLTIGSTTLKIAKCFNGNRMQCIKENEEEKNEILHKFFKLHSDDTRVRLAHRLAEIGQAAMVKGKELQGTKERNGNRRLISVKEQVVGGQGDKERVTFQKGNGTESNMVIKGNRTRGKNKVVSFADRKSDESYASHLQRALQNIVPTYHKTALCSHGHKHRDVIPRYGLHAGIIVLHGVVKNLDRCIKYCCASHTCDLALIVRKECFTITCTSKLHCQFVPNRGHRRTEAVRIYRGQLGYKAMLDTSDVAKSNRKMMNKTRSSHGVANPRIQKEGRFRHRTNQSIERIGLINVSMSSMRQKIPNAEERTPQKSPWNNSFAAASKHVVASGVHSTPVTLNRTEHRSQEMLNMTIVNAKRNFSDENYRGNARFNAKSASDSTLYSKQLMVNGNASLGLSKSASARLLPTHFSRNLTSSVGASQKNQQGSTPNPLYNISLLLKFYDKPLYGAESYNKVLSLDGRNSTQKDALLHSKGTHNPQSMPPSFDNAKTEDRKRHREKTKSHFKGTKHPKKSRFLKHASSRASAGSRTMISVFLKPHRVSKQEGLSNLLHSLKKDPSGSEEVTGFNKSTNESTVSSVNRPRIEMLGPDMLNMTKTTKHLDKQYDLQSSRNYMSKEGFILEKTQTVNRPLKPMPLKSQPAPAVVYMERNRNNDAALRSIKNKAKSVSLEAHKQPSRLLITAAGIRRDGVSVSSSRRIKLNGELNSNKLISQNSKPALVSSLQFPAPSLGFPSTAGNSSISNMTNMTSNSKESIQSGKHQQYSRHSQAESETFFDGNINFESLVRGPTMSKIKAYGAENLKASKTLSADKTSERIVYGQPGYAKISRLHQIPRNMNALKQGNGSPPISGMSQFTTAAQRYKDLLYLPTRLFTTKRTSKKVSDTSITKAPEMEKHLNSIKQSNDKPSQKELVSKGRYEIQKELASNGRNATQNASLKNETAVLGTQGRKEIAIKRVHFIGGEYDMQNSSYIGQARMIANFSAKEKSAGNHPKVVQKEVLVDGTHVSKSSNSIQQQVIEDMPSRSLSALQSKGASRSSKALDNRNITGRLDEAAKQILKSLKHRNSNLQPKHTRHRPKFHNPSTRKQGFFDILPYRSQGLEPTMLQIHQARDRNASTDEMRSRQKLGGSTNITEESVEDPKQLKIRRNYTASMLQHQLGTASTLQNYTVPIEQRNKASFQQHVLVPFRQNDTTSIHKHGTIPFKQKYIASVLQHVSTSVKQNDTTLPQQLGKTSVEQNDTSSVHQHGATSVRQNDTTLTQQLGKISVEQNDTSSVHQHGATSVQQNNTTLPHQHGKISVEQNDTSSVYQHGTTSAKQNDTTLTHQHGKTSVEQNDTSSVHQHGTTSVKQNDTTLTQQLGKTSIEQNDTSSVHQHGTTSVQQNVTSSTHQHGTISIKQSDATSTHQHGTTSIQQNDTTSTHQHGKTSIQQNDAISAQQNNTPSTHQHGTTSIKQNDTIATHQHGTISSQQNDATSTNQHGTISVLENYAESIYQQGRSSIKQNDTTVNHHHGTTLIKQNNTESIYQHGTTSIKENDTTSIHQHATTSIQKKYAKSIYQHGKISIRQHGTTSTEQNDTTSVHHVNTTSVQQNDVNSFQQGHASSIQHHGTALLNRNDTTSIQQGDAKDRINKQKALQNLQVADFKPKTEKEAFMSVDMPFIYPEMENIDSQGNVRQRNITKLSALSAKNKGELTIDDTYLFKGNEKNSHVNTSEHSQLSVPVKEVYKYTTKDMNETDLPVRYDSAFENTTEHAKQNSRRPIESSILNAKSQNRFAEHRLTLERSKAMNEMSKKEQNATQVHSASRINQTRNSATLSLSYQNFTIGSNGSKSTSSLVMYPRLAGAMPSTKYRPNRNSSSLENRALRREQNFGNHTVNGSVIFRSNKEARVVAAVTSSHILPVNASKFSTSQHSTLNKSSKYVPETVALTSWHSMHSNTKLPINKSMSQNSSANVNRNMGSAAKNFSYSDGSTVNEFHHHISYPSPTGKHKYNATSKTIPNHLVGHKTTSTKPTHLRLNYTKRYKSNVKNGTKQNVSNVFESIRTTSTRNTSSTSGMTLSPVMPGNFTSKYTQTPYWPYEYFPWRNYKHPTPKLAVSPLKSSTSTPYEFSYKRLFWKNVPGQSPFWIQYQNLARNLTGNVLSRSNQKTTLPNTDYKSIAQNVSSLSNETLGKEEIMPIKNVSKETRDPRKNNSRASNGTALKVKNETHNSSLYDASHDSKHLHGVKILKMLNSSAISSNLLINKTISETVKIKNSTYSSGNSFSELNRTAALGQNHRHMKNKVVNKGPKIVNNGTDYSNLNYTAHGSNHLLFTSSRVKTDNGSKRVFSNGLFTNASTERFSSHRMPAISAQKAASGLVTKLNKTAQFLNTVRKTQNPDVTIRVHYKLKKPSHVKHKRPTNYQKSGTQKSHATGSQKNQTTGIQRNQTTGIQKSKAPDVIRVYYHLENHRGKMHTEKRPKERPKEMGRTSKTPDTIKVYYNPGRFAHPKKKVNDSIRLGVSKRKSANLTEFYGIKKLYMQDSLEDKKLGMGSIAPATNANTTHQLTDLSLKETTLKVDETGNTPTTVKLLHPSKNVESKESSSLSAQVSKTQMKSPYKFMSYVPPESVGPTLPQNSNYFQKKPKGAKTSTGDRKSVPRADSNRDISVSPKHSFHRKKPDSDNCNLLGIYVDRVLGDGAKAGNFYPVLFVKDPVHCHRKCCADQRCNFAMFYRDFCYLIECFSKLSCRLVHSKAVTRHPHLLAKIREPENRSLSRVYKFPPEMGLTHVPTMFIRPKSVKTVRGKNRSVKSQKEALMDLFHSLLTQLEGRHPTSKREYVTVVPHLGQKVRNSNTTSPIVIHNSTRLPKIATTQSARRNEQLPLFAKPFFGMPLNRTSAHTANQNFPNNDDTYLSDYLNQTFASVSKPFHPTTPSKVKLSTTHSLSKRPTLHSALSAVSPLEVKKIVADLAAELSQMNLKLKDVLPELRYVLLHSRSRLHSSNNVSRTIFDGIKELRAAELRGRVSSISGHSVMPIAATIFRPRQGLGSVSGTKTTMPVKDNHKMQELKSLQAAEQLMNSVKDKSRPKVNENSRLTCIITSVRGGATLFGGPRAGVFTSHGGGMSLDQCIERCCTAESCHVALLVSGHCYTVKCYTASLCRIVPVKRAGHYLMTVAYVRRRITYSTGEQGKLHTSIEDATLPVSAVVCTESVVYEGYTLRGGYDAGHFTYKGEVGTLADCIEQCCNANFCDLVFMVTNQCYLVYCYSKDGCQHVKAYHGVLYRTRIAYLHSRKNIIPPWVPRNIELRGAISTVKKDFTNGIMSVNKGHPTTPVPGQQHHLHPTTTAKTFPINSPSITKNSFLQTCVLAKILAQTTMAEGHKSGKLLFRGRKTNDRDCIKDCCLNSKCNIALLVQDYCFNVVCKSKRACKPVKAVKSKHSVRLAVIRTTITRMNGMFTLLHSLTFDYHLYKRRPYYCKGN